MHPEQNNTDSDSQGLQLHKLHRIKLQDLQKGDKLLKEVYSWVTKDKRPEPRQMINGASKEFWKYRVQCTNRILFSQRGHCIKNAKHSLTSKLFNKCRYHGGECSTCLSCCLTPLAQVALRFRKLSKGLVKKFSEGG